MYGKKGGREGFPVPREYSIVLLLEIPVPSLNLFRQRAALISLVLPTMPSDYLMTPLEPFLASSLTKYNDAAAL